MIDSYYNNFSHGFYPPNRFHMYPYPHRPYPYAVPNKYEKNISKNEISSHEKNIPNSKTGNNCNNCKINEKEETPKPLFEVFGIKLFFDDILLISLIFFLYSEGVKDQSLFISLILLLLS